MKGNFKMKIIMWEQKVKNYISFYVYFKSLVNSECTGTVCCGKKKKKMQPKAILKISICLTDLILDKSKITAKDIAIQKDLWRSVVLLHVLLIMFFVSYYGF